MSKTVHLPGTSVQCVCVCVSHDHRVWRQTPAPASGSFDASCLPQHLTTLAYAYKRGTFSVTDSFMLR